MSRMAYPLKLANQKLLSKIKEVPSRIPSQTRTSLERNLQCKMTKLSLVMNNVHRTQHINFHRKKTIN